MRYQNAKTNNPVLNQQNESRYQKNTGGNMERKIADDSSENNSQVVSMSEPGQNRFYYDDADNLEWEFIQSHE